MDRLQAAEQLRKALQMFASTLDTSKALEIPAVYPAWESMHSYTVGDIVSYGVNSVGDPQLYKVVQSHVSQTGWEPNVAPSLFDAFGLDDSGYPIWSQPSGAHDAYNTGDIVNYNGQLYESLINGNAWSPDVYPAGWKLVDSDAVEPEPGPEPETYPQWVQPSGAHDAYNTGDRVVYNGTVYESTINGNVWAPDEYPQGWKEV